MRYFFRAFMVFLLLAEPGLTYTQVKLSDPAATCGVMTAWMRANLSLSESQAARVEDVNVEYDWKNLVVQTGFLSKRQRQHTSRIIEQARDEELKGILTAEQFLLWQTAKRRKVR